MDLVENAGGSEQLAHPHFGEIGKRVFDERVLNGHVAEAVLGRGSVLPGEVRGNTHFVGDLEVEHEVEQVGVEGTIRVATAFFLELLFELEARIAVDGEPAPLSEELGRAGEAQGNERCRGLPSHVTSSEDAIEGAADVVVALPARGNRG